MNKHRSGLIWELVMTDQEKMERELEWLIGSEWHDRNCPQYPAVLDDPKKYAPCICGYDKAIATLRQALEQPKREWVGLTDEEIAEGAKQSWVHKQAFESAVWWAEEKLKEKNT